MREWMIYGAYGYTGELIAREAARRGMKPILAGRDAAKTEQLARPLGLKWREFPLSDPEVPRGGVVLHCAGPFSRTSRPMVDACLAAAADYLDITGEIDVFESVFARDGEARGRGVALIPGVGFDVVPTDAIAAALASRLPGAEELLLAFSTSRGASASRGTIRTAIEGAGKGGAIRQGGRIVRVPLAHDVREIPFPGGVRPAMTIPWGDISTAYRTTGIPDIRVYRASSRRGITTARRIARLAPLFAIPGVTAILRRLVRGGGPSEQQRAEGHIELWGSVRRGGESASMTMTTPEGYELTVRSALAAVERLLDAERIAGAFTPSQAFGAEFATSLEGVTASEPE
jgi:short subunit dehydrogenase-like uncharacterized protein